MATKTLIEQEGTYARSTGGPFYVKTVIKYPQIAEEQLIINQN